MIRTNTVAPDRFLSLLAQPVCGYAFSREQRQALIDSGIPAANVWTEGLDSESLDEVIYKQRGRRGTLIVAGFSKFLGNTKAEVMAAARKIELAGVKVIDIANEASVTLSDHINRALAFVAGAARMKTNRRARYIGGKGGAAKGVAAAARRCAQFDDEVGKRLCSLKIKGLTWALKAWALGIPETTAIRHYR
jgi:hypothetical protein